MPTVPDVRVGVQGNCHWRTDADDGEVGGSMSELTRGGGRNERQSGRRRMYMLTASILARGQCRAGRVVQVIHSTTRHPMAPESMA